ncbi:AbrB/MazE/SpoVT family DNA-binding domain-containing protein [Haladaptatus sp. NG-WS-4]
MSSKSENGDHVVRISRKGQATIPKSLREKYGIEIPGRVRFREEDGELVVEPVPTPNERFGSLGEDYERGEVITHHREEQTAERQAEDTADQRDYQRYVDHDDRDETTDE